MREFIGLLYLAEAYKGNRQSLGELWGKEKESMEKFALVMSLRRFKLLLRCLRFDDLTARLQLELRRFRPICDDDDEKKKKKKK